MIYIEGYHSHPCKNFQKAYNLPKAGSVVYLCLVISDKSLAGGRFEKSFLCVVMSGRGGHQPGSGQRRIYSTKSVIEFGREDTEEFL